MAYLMKPTSRRTHNTRQVSDTSLGGACVKDLCPFLTFRSRQMHDEGVSPALDDFFG
jgi:hypothetical protein